MDSKLTNPKDLIGSDKMPLHLWPETATLFGAMALLEGALKYGRGNWRVAGVRASIYYDACRRHIDRWFEGEDNDPDSGLPHLAHALACLAILVDAKAAGKLNDDRMVAGGFGSTLAELTPHVARLKAKYADRDPKHYTISDSSEMVEDIPMPARRGEDRCSHENFSEGLLCERRDGHKGNHMAWSDYPKLYAGGEWPDSEMVEVKDDAEGAYLAGLKAWRESGRWK